MGNDVEVKIKGAATKIVRAPKLYIANWRYAYMSTTRDQSVRAKHLDPKSTLVFFPKRGVNQPQSLSDILMYFPDDVLEKSDESDGESSQESQGSGHTQQQGQGRNTLELQVEISKGNSRAQTAGWPDWQIADWPRNIHRSTASGEGSSSS
ncbi:hypothetical protein GYMLUDRAFT_34743 [Collybiopsis luxurians FD-317 M1]|nr:hypothetical protein GYMLUDRAFT_34743 [Collybiopsis luxurians FD-317 M1]